MNHILNTLIGALGDSQELEGMILKLRKFICLLEIQGYRETRDK